MRQLERRWKSEVAGASGRHPLRAKHAETRSRPPAAPHKPTTEAWWGAPTSSTISSTICAHQDHHPAAAADVVALNHATGRADT